MAIAQNNVYSSRCCLTQINWNQALTRPWKLINGSGVTATIYKVLVTVFAIIISLGLIIVPICGSAIKTHYIHKQ
jgi:hypothetical protein